MEKICENCGKSFLRPVYNGQPLSIGQWLARRCCSLRCDVSFKKKNNLYQVSEDTKTKLKEAWKRNPKRNFPTGNKHWKIRMWLEKEKTYLPKSCEWCGHHFNKKSTTRPVDWKRQRFCSPLCVNKYASSKIGTGKNHHAWKGGRCSLNEKIRKLPQTAIWRNRVFKRDGYTCQDCGKKGKLHADHKVPLAVLIGELKITSLKQARHNKKLWQISNGKTLCISCHQKTETYGGRTLGKTYHTHII